MVTPTVLLALAAAACATGPRVDTAYTKPTFRKVMVATPRLPKNGRTFTTQSKNQIRRNERTSRRK